MNQKKEKGTIFQYIAMSLVVVMILGCVLSVGAATGVSYSSGTNINGVTTSYSSSTITNGVGSSVSYGESYSQSTGKTPSNTGQSMGISYSKLISPTDAVGTSTVTKKGLKYNYSLYVTWKKIAGVKGYQIKVSNGKWFNGIYTVNTNRFEKSATSWTNKSASCKIQIRSFWVDKNGNKIYGPWEDAKCKLAINNYTKR